MLDILTIGDALIDTFLVLKGNQASVLLHNKQKKLCLDYGEKVPIDKSDSEMGGNAPNVAVGAKKLGLKTAIITEIGDDINGNLIKTKLKQAGVDTKCIFMRKGQETRYSVIINYNAERTILSYHPERKYQLPKKMPKTKWIYYTSLGKGFGNLQTELVEYLEKHPDIKLAMNPGSYQFTKGLRMIKRIISKAEIIIVNKEEAVKIINKKLPIRTLLKKLHATHGGITVITDGTKGSYATNGELSWFMPTYPFTAVAKTGAGDAYTSGFLSAMINGKAIPRSMQWGTANAGKVVQEYGAQEGLCTQYTINKTIKTYKEIEPVLL